jgi:uncharacterized membrane protein
MCFSASASFGAGMVLSIIGVASIKKAQSPSHLIFASIPFIFGVQQITEGFVWLSLLNPNFASFQQVSTYLYLFVAQVVWPVWVPLGILQLEPKESRRILQKILVPIGAIVSIYLAACLWLFHVEASVVDYHIAYQEDYPEAVSRYFGGFYVLATVLPPFFSRIRRMWWLGTAILIAYVITSLFFTGYIVSVWCFFAAVISISVYIILLELKKPQKLLQNKI